MREEVRGNSYHRGNARSQRHWRPARTRTQRPKMLELKHQVSFANNVSTSFALALSTQNGPSHRRDQDSRGAEKHRSSEKTQSVSKDKPDPRQDRKSTVSTTKWKLTEKDQRGFTKFRRRTKETDCTEPDERYSPGQFRRRSRWTGTGEVRTHGGSWPAKGTTPKRWWNQTDEETSESPSYAACVPN